MFPTRTAFHLILFLSVLSMAACQNEPAGQGAPAEKTVADKTADNKNVAEKPAAQTAQVPSDLQSGSDLDVSETSGFSKPEQKIPGLAKLLNGKWRMASDQAILLQFVDGKYLRKYKNGKLTSELEFTIDPSCQSTGCAKENGKITYGWCIKTQNNQCLVVKRIDARNLTFHTFGKKDSQTFNKVEG